MQLIKIESVNLFTLVAMYFLLSDFRSLLTFGLFFNSFIFTETSLQLLCATAKAMAARGRTLLTLLTFGLINPLKLSIGHQHLGYLNTRFSLIVFKQSSNYTRQCQGAAIQRVRQLRFPFGVTETQF
jgi:hypothetical protein